MKTKLPRFEYGAAVRTPEGDTGSVLGFASTPSGKTYYSIKAGGRPRYYLEEDLLEFSAEFQ